MLLQPAFWKRPLGFLQVLQRHQQRWLPGLITATCTLGLWQAGLWRSLEQQSYNLLFQLREQMGANIALDWDDRIAVIAIDEASLKQYGRFPWSRQRYAELLDTLAIAQPAAVAFDILMVEATSDDAAFAEAFFSSNVVLAIGNDGQGNALEIAPLIAKNASGAYLSGHVQSLPDTDGVSRQVQLYEGQLPALGIAALQVYSETLANTLNATEIVDKPPPSITTQPWAWLNWPGPVSPNRSASDDLAVYSFQAVQSGQVPPAVFQNKLVLVGVTAAGLDPVRSPYHLNPPIAGVFFHAAVIDNLLNDRFLRRPSLAWVGLLILGMGLLANSGLQPRGPYSRLWMTLGLSMLWLAIALAAFIGGWWLPLAAPVGCLWVTAAGLQIQEQKQRQQLMALFAMNVSPQMAHLIWQQKAAILKGKEIAAQELVATVLFVDIRGFTQIAEQMPSKALLIWLNRYFEVMTDCIIAHGGMVDKYIGDAIMAVFGAPFARTHSAQIGQDAIAAVAASLDMHQRLEQLNQEFAASGQPTVRFGIGIHTGALIAGTVGSRQRLNYSLFGDTVNVASRLESLTKEISKAIPYRVLITTVTQGYIKQHFSTAPFRSVVLRGRRTETLVYTVKPLDKKG
ncbi:MAG: adenylate/guanylate cyclase domain-containing protein [Leptolyngbyaceae cyanobacterium SL_1_1]|nr:adenylate/guanylate cyclase domain-containing protein [Leptolyngbyaceae cyanobacterium SL_1_1]